MGQLTEGARAPDFDVTGADGPIRLSDFAGKALVVYFYPKDDTAGCTREAQDFSDLVPDFAKIGVAVLGVSKDSLASHAKFTKKYTLDVPLGSDPEGAMVAAFGAWVEKSMYGRTYMGIERSTYLIDKDGVVQRIWRKVRVPGHAVEVLKAAQTLQG